MSRTHQPPRPGWGRDRPDIPDGMLDSSNPLPPEFFDHPRCLLVLAADKATDAEISQGRAAGDSEGGVVVKE